MFAMCMKAYCVDFIVYTKPISLNDTCFSMALYNGGLKVSRRKRKALDKRKKLATKEKCLQQKINGRCTKNKKEKIESSLQKKILTPMAKKNARGKKEKGHGKKSRTGGKKKDLGERKKARGK